MIIWKGPVITFWSEIIFTSNTTTKNFFNEKGYYQYVQWNSKGRIYEILCRGDGVSQTEVKIGTWLRNASRMSSTQKNGWGLCCAFNWNLPECTDYLILLKESNYNKSLLGKNRF